MISKAPLAIAEEIRCLDYLEDGGWDMDRLDTTFGRMRKRVGEDNPHFEAIFLTFEACRDSVEDVLSQMRADIEDLWLEANTVKNDFEDIHQRLAADLSDARSTSASEQLGNRLNNIGLKLEYLEGRILEISDPFIAARAVKMMRMACMSFLSLAVTAEWPRSPGRGEHTTEGDKKSKMDYVREVFLADPDMKVEAAFITAEENFQKVHPGQKFLTYEHVAKFYKKKIREQCSGQLALRLSPPPSQAQT